MAKKKQFAGKKTKLARLPLTQALAGQAESGGSAAPHPAASLPSSPGLSPTWDEVGAGSGGALAAAFLALVRELADLRSDLQSSSPAAACHHLSYLPPQVPSEPRLLAALSQARQNLRELQDLLSPP